MTEQCPLEMYLVKNDLRLVGHKWTKISTHSVCNSYVWKCPSPWFKSTGIRPCFSCQDKIIRISLFDDIFHAIQYDLSLPIVQISLQFYK